MSSRNSTIDAVRCVGACAIVIGHFCTLLQEWVYVFHLPLFIVLGGVLYKSEERGFGVFLRHKFRSLMYPFYFYGGVLFVYWLIFERHYRVSGQGFAWYKSFYGILYAGDGSDYWLRFGGAIWFLPCYFSIVVCYQAITRFTNSRKQLLALLVLVSLFAYYYNTSTQHINLPFGLNQALSCLPWFWLGTLLTNVRFLEFLDKHKEKYIGALLCLMFLGLSILAGPGIDIYSCSLGRSYINLYVQSISGILFCIIFGYLIKGYRIVSLIGLASLSIMCIHQPVGRIAYKAIALLTNTSHEQLVAGYYAPAISIFIVLICTLTHFFAKALVERIWRAQ